MGDDTEKKVEGKRHGIFYLFPYTFT